MYQNLPMDEEHLLFRAFRVPSSERRHTVDNRSLSRREIISPMLVLNSYLHYAALELGVAETDTIHQLCHYRKVSFFR